MRRRRIALGLAIAGGVAVLAVAVLPGLAARRVAREISEALGTPVRVGALRWSPFTATWSLTDLRIAAEHGPPALAARGVTAEIQLGDLLRGVYRVRDLALDRARVRLRATPAGWQLPLPGGPAGAATPLPAVRIDWAVAPGARIRLEPRTGVRSSLRLRRLELTTTIAPEGVSGEFWTRGRLDRGSLAVVGRLRTRSDARRLRLRVAAGKLDLARALRLAEDTPIADLRGSLDLRAKYDEAGDSAHVARRIAGSAGARDLALRASGIPGLWLRQASLSRFEIDLDRRSLALGRVSLHGPEIWVRRTGSELSIPGLLSTAPPAKGEKQWTLALARAEVADGTVHHLDTQDDARSFDVAVERAQVGPLAATRTAVPFSLVAALGAGGRVTAAGQLVRDPLSVKLHADLADLALPLLATFANAPLRFESGRAAGAFDLAFARGALGTSGKVTISDVKTRSPDPERPEDVMAFKEARLVLREARTDPPSATFDKVEIDWPYVLIDRSPAAIFPLSLLARPGAEPGAPTRSVRVDALRVLGGRIDFRDATLTPAYWRAIANLGIEAREIEGPALRITELRANGLVDELSPLKVEGTIGTRTHLVAEVERLALPPFNAYLQGTASYTVSSGLVSGRSELTIDRSQLEVNNQVVLSRLGLSGSPGDDFVKRQLGIPLTLALALMKDYRGDIALDLPFGGDVSEPTFSMRSVVLQGIVQAVRGAILSPLNALGRVLVRDGRIERIDLDPIPFRPGERTLDDAGRERVAQVARVLASHPILKLRLRGLVSQADVDRLHDEAVLSALVDASAAEPLRAFLRARLAGTPPPALDDAQRERLEKLEAGLPWPASVLHDLAVDRGAVTTATLILEHKIEPARVAVDPAETPAPERLATLPGVAVEVREH